MADENGRESHAGETVGATVGGIGGGWVGAKYGAKIGWASGGGAVSAKIPLAILGAAVGALAGDRIGLMFDQRRRNKPDTRPCGHAARRSSVEYRASGRWPQPDAQPVVADWCLSRESNPDG